MVFDNHRASLLLFVCDELIFVSILLHLIWAYCSLRILSGTYSWWFKNIVLDRNRHGERIDTDFCCCFCSGWNSLLAPRSCPINWRSQPASEMFISWCSCPRLTRIFIMDLICHNVIEKKTKQNKRKTYLQKKLV